jgi:hypothetical protein
MKKLVVIVAVALAAPSEGKVWITPYRCDGVTPLAPADPNYPTLYRDIMVGTRLVFVIESDASGLYYAPDLHNAPGPEASWLLWSGTLLIPWDDTALGTLSGRDYNKATLNYDGSALPAAGRPFYTRVRYREKVAGVGFELNVESFSIAGAWFVFDYHAERTGTCAVLLNQFIGVPVPTETLLFRHVPSRDFNGDTIVDFRDFALLASHWGSTVGADPNDPGAILDLNGDAQVDFDDLALFSEYWLERTDCDKAARDPNHPPSL